MSYKHVSFSLEKLNHFYDQNNLYLPVIVFLSVDEQQ